MIDHALYMKVYPTFDHPPRFYGLPKANKYAHETNCKLDWNHFLPMCMISGDSFISTSRETEHQVRNSKDIEVVRTLMHRVDTIVSDGRDKVEEKSHVKKAPNMNGYHDWIINSIPTIQPSLQSTTSVSSDDTSDDV